MIMDNRKNNGGNKNAGRKSKAEEQNLIEKLSPLDEIAFKALTDAINDGKDWAVKLYFQYSFGMPKQMVVQENINYKEEELSEAEIKRIKNEVESKY
jgi:hypothetical protein